MGNHYEIPGADKYVRPPFTIISKGNEILGGLIDKLRDGVFKDPLNEILYNFFNEYIEQKGVENVNSLTKLEVGIPDYYRQERDILKASLIKLKEHLEDHSILSPLKDEVVMKIPKYYMSYGAHFKDKFLMLGPSKGPSLYKLSAGGVLWKCNTLKALQECNEILKEEDPALFMTANFIAPESFQQFCFDIHPFCYAETGFLSLPTSDAAAMSLIVFTDTAAIQKSTIGLIGSLVTKHVEEWPDNLVDAFRNSFTHSGRSGCTSLERFALQVNKRICEQEVNKDLSRGDLAGYYSQVIETLNPPTAIRQHQSFRPEYLAEVTMGIREPMKSISL